jgi:nitrile hydratase accessory protein
MAAEGPPRRNGELAFDEPWESRLFGITMALCEREVVDWDDFRRQLIVEIARADAGHPDGSGGGYWHRWERALLAIVGGAVDLRGLQRRADELAARPPGHDHGDHVHDGGHGSPHSGPVLRSACPSRGTT